MRTRPTRALSLNRDISRGSYHQFSAAL